jgi:hypothetical protein
MKMIILRQAAEEWGHSMPVASIYLSLSDAEVHILCDLEQEEKERREQWEEDVAAYTACGLEIASDITSKDITPQQGQHLDDLEKIQKDNLAEDAPSGYDVHPEDILAAQRFVRERVKDSPTRQAMLHGLKLHTGADYSRELLCSIKLGKLDSDDEN